MWVGFVRPCSPTRNVVRRLDVGFDRLVDPAWIEGGPNAVVSLLFACVVCRIRKANTNALIEVGTWIVDHEIGHALEVIIDCDQF